MQSSNITSLLQQDHENFSKLLRLLDDQIITMAQAQRPNYDLMLDIMFYMIHYPNVTHHQVEEVLFKKLLSYYPEIGSIVDDLIIQHQQLYQLSTEFETLLRAVTAESGAMIPRERIVSLGRQYSEQLRDHMTLEERQILPLAMDMLPAQDWYEIGENLDKHLPDPLFGEKVMADYKALYRWIVE